MKKTPGDETEDPCQTLFSCYSMQHSSEESNMRHLLEPLTSASSLFILQYHSLLPLLRAEQLNKNNVGHLSGLFKHQTLCFIKDRPCNLFFRLPHFYSVTWRMSIVQLPKDKLEMSFDPPAEPCTEIIGELHFQRLVGILEGSKLAEEVSHLSASAPLLY